ncbi:MAG TPA: M56 family metallopeptidase [Candidatus Sulfotelmatobacter sp.]
MTTLTNWISPGVMQSLGWALLHFLWQGTALAALAAGLMALSRKATMRYAVGIVMLVMMLVAPAATFLLFGRQEAKPGDAAIPSMTSAAGHAVKSTAVATVTIHPSSISQSIPVLPWLVEAWLLGVAFFSLRSAGGFLLLERERRRRSAAVSDRVLEMCYGLQGRIGIDRAIQYCECAWLQAPAVIGWFRPIVFLPVCAVTGLSEDQLRSVIAHELAHIRRYDPFVNVFQVAVETLLFYHPAVWWLNKRIRAEREHCCDETAVALCGNAVEYARALTLMEEWRSAPALAMAANRGPLADRIIRVLGLKTLGSGMRSIGLTGSLLCLTAALIAGNTLLGMASPKTAQAAPMARIFGTASGSASPQASASASSNPNPTTKPSAGHAPSQSATSTPSPSASSYVDAMKAAGLGDLSVDELIALKTQDVTPDYVRGLQELGMKPDVNSLIAMREQDVTPEYVRDLRSAGLNPNQNQLIGLKVQGADAEYYRGLKAAGIDADADKLIALKVQDVTPEYVKELRAAGFEVNADQVIAMKVQDVTPSYVKEMRALGLQPSANDLVAMRVQDVTPEYVRDIESLGFKPSTNEFIAMRVQDVTPAYIKALQSAGYKVNINDIISAKVQDVTPEFIEQAKQHGFKDLTLQKLIQLRELGILDSKADL